MSPTWKYDNLLVLDDAYRVVAANLISSRLPNYPLEHSAKLCGSAPNEYFSRCVMEGDTLVGVMAFSVGKLDTVEIVAFVATRDRTGIGKFLMESFLAEVKEKKKSAILTYVEPLAENFFAKYGFTKTIPARSLYEKIINKYVSARLMYCNLLTRLDKGETRYSVTQKRLKELEVDDRLLVLVDGTLIPRQAVVQEINRDEGTVFIHYYFWNHRYDEWIYLHSPRVCWDIPLPPEPPKNAGENSVTMNQVKAVNELEQAVGKKQSIIETLGAWPAEFRINASVEVKVEGDWVQGVVLEKNKEFCYCKFTYRDQEWFQDFPRDSIRIQGKTALEVLIEKNAHWRVKRTEEKPPARSSPKGKQPVVASRRKPKLTIEVSPLKGASGGSVSDRTLRKRRRDESVPGPQTPLSSTSTSCCVCGKEHDGKTLVQCNTCLLSVHLPCYMLDESRIHAPWNCDLCVQSVISPKGLAPSCVICGNTGTQSIMTQTLAYKWIHVKCGKSLGLEFFPCERRFANYKLTTPSSRTTTHACSVCDKDQGATSKCADDACTRHAHMVCADANWIVSVDEESNVEFFCPSHRR